MRKSLAWALLATCLAAFLAAVPAVAQPPEDEPEEVEGDRGARPTHWTTDRAVGRGRGPVSQEALETSPSRTDWLHFGGNYQSWRYSPIEELTPAALPRLRVAWAAQTGVPGQLEASPVVYDGILYLTSAHNRLLAYDAATGELLWRYDHQNPGDLRICCGPANRGVAIAGDAVLMGTLDARLVALHRKSGVLLWETVIDDYAKGLSVTSAPLVIGDLAVIGIAGGEYGVRGFFDAYDVRTGERRWRHHTVPAAGEPGVETWAGNSYESGGAPTWVTGSYDPGSRVLYWATGNPSPDWNGDVREGDNLYSDSVLAVDPMTGERLWHFQFTPHDVWDYDGNTELFLVDVELDGETVPVVAQANRNGFFYLIDRRDGRFLRATQYAHQVNWAKGIDQNGRPIYDPEMVPKEEDPPRVCPGLAGGNNGAYNSAYSPRTGMIYAPVIESCMSFRKGIVVFIEGIPYVGGEPMRVDTIAGKSYGHLSAIDVATGEIKWSYRDPESMMAGVLTTAGGAVITGNARGHVLGFDAVTGEEVWRFPTGSGIRSHPIAYQLDGKQYLAVGSGGGGGVQYSTGASRMIPEGSTLFVFELPPQ
jgi:alcohol dehydrogenase (cytochrome c)